MDTTQYIPKEHEQFKYYNASVQITVQADKTKGNYQTVRIEASPKKGVGYDHKSKLAIQISRKELPQVTAILMGWHKNITAKYHGTEKNKGYEIEARKTGLMIRLYSKDNNSLTLFLDPSEVFEVSALCIRQLTKTQPGLQSAEVMAILRNTVGRMSDG